MDVPAVEFLKEVEPETWDDLAARVGGTYFHCHACTRFAATRSGGEPLFIKALDKRGQCVGVAAGTLSSSGVWPFSRYCNRAEFPSLPATACGDAAAEQAALERIEGELRQRGVFVVATASYGSVHSAEVLSALGYDLVERSEFYVDLTRDLEAIWSGFLSARRRAVRRAEDRGAVTRRENTEEALQRVFAFHEESMTRRGADHAARLERFRLAQRQLLQSGRADVFVTYLDGTPVSAILCGWFNGWASGLVAGSSEAGYKCFAPVQQAWTQIQWYKSQGIRCLSLGGAKADETGLYQFKSQFGSTVVVQPAGSKVISRLGARLDRLRTALRKIRK